MDFRGLLETLPRSNFAFAYGSGVFEQAGYENAKEAPMIDMVVATSNAARWHGENLGRNRSHYSLLGSFGGAGLARIQEDMGAGIYYNSLVPIPSGIKGAKAGQLFKYGVISSHTLVDDLVNWRSLYVSGRMHKPVLMVGECDDPVILAAARENLRHALRCALLLLPPSFTAEELFTTIAGLSYTGDFRMVFGENPHKVRNIVTKSMPHFYRLYLPVLRASFSHVVSDASPAGSAGYPSSSPSFSPLLSSSDFGSGSDSERSEGSFAPSSSSPSSPSSLFAAALEGKANVLFRQNVEPETRLALGMSLPYHLQKRMAAAFFERESELQGTALDGKFFKRLRERQRKAAELQQSIRAALQASSAKRGGASPSFASMGAGGSGGGGALLRTRAIAFAASGREMMQRARLQRLQWLVSRREKKEAAIARAAAGRSAEEVVVEEEEDDQSRAAPSLARMKITESFKRTALKALENRTSGKRDTQGRAKLLREELKHLVDEEGTLLFPPGSVSVAQSTSAASVSSAAAAAAAASGGGYSSMATVSFSKAAKDPQIVAFWDALLTKQGSLSSVADSSPLILSSTTPSLPPDLLALRVRESIRPSIAHIVGSSARTQSLKGIMTAGPIKAVQYAGQKLHKFFAALKKK